MANKKRQEKTQDARLEARFQTAEILPLAAKEGHEILSEGQYLHMKDLIKQLTGFGIQEFDSNLRIEAFGNYWELKEKGGTLGNINLRVYFAFNKDKNSIVVLSTYKKEEDGPASPRVRIRLDNRYNQYLNGYFDGNLITYSRKDT